MSTAGALQACILSWMSWGEVMLGRKWKVMQQSIRISSMGDGMWWCPTGGIERALCLAMGPVSRETDDASLPLIHTFFFSFHPR